MTSSTGTRHPLSVGDSMGSMYPIVNPRFDAVAPVVQRKTQRVVYGVRLTTPDFDTAIGTDDYTFTVSVVNHAMYVVNAYYIDPIGLSVDSTNYNTFDITDGTTTLCSATTAYGVTANEVQEITKANTLANRLLAAGDTLYCKITGTVAGRIINDGILVFVVCDEA